MPKYLIQTLDPRFRGEIVGVTFTDGAAIVDTDESPAAFAAYSYFQRTSYSLSPVEEAAPAEDSTGPGPEDPGPFDPGTHSVPEVLAYLATAGADEQARVRTAEAVGKNRNSILGGTASVEANPQQGAQS